MWSIVQLYRISKFLCSFSRTTFLMSISILYTTSSTTKHSKYLKRYENVFFYNIKEKNKSMEERITFLKIALFLDVSLLNINYTHQPNTNINCALPLLNLWNEKRICFHHAALSPATKHLHKLTQTNLPFYLNDFNCACKN